MKLFGRSGGYWLFWISAVYMIIGFINIWVYKFTNAEYIQIVYVIILGLPLFIRPMANWLNMHTIWDR